MRRAGLLNAGTPPGQDEALRTERQKLFNWRVGRNYHAAALAPPQPPGAGPSLIVRAALGGHPLLHDTRAAAVGVKCDMTAKRSSRVHASDPRYTRTARSFAFFQPSAPLYRSGVTHDLRPRAYGNIFT